MLEQRLPDCMPVDHDTKIFVDLKIETGSAWPDELRHALKTSRCILAVWSPEYFRSEWCLAEWHTFREREKVANMISNSNSRGLIYPVKFADGDHFPQAAKDVQQRDLTKRLFLSFFARRTGKARLSPASKRFLAMEGPW